jgi:hypothetical protein
MPRHPDTVIVPNRIFTEARKALSSPNRPGQCMSRSELADAINQALDRLYPDRNLRSQYVDSRWVGKLERGEHRWPSAERRAALRVVFAVAADGDLDLYSPRRTEILIAAPVTRPPSGLSDWDQVVAEALIEWRLLVDNDKVFGPAYAIIGVRQQLGLLDVHIRQAPADFTAALTRISARYAESAAWLLQSLDDDAEAEHWMARSLSLASQIGDTAMIAWAQYRSSQHWLNRHDPTRAADAAFSAATHESALPAPMRAAIRVQQAHALAVRGSPDQAMTLIDQAHRWAADRHHGKPDGEHGTYCTGAYIEVYRGACLLQANQPHDSLTVLDAALDSIPRLHRQDHATALLYRAAALRACKQPDAAATTAHSALSIVRRAGSRRLLHRLCALGSSLEPHRNLAEVSAFLDDLAEACSGIRG